MSALKDRLAKAWVEDLKSRLPVGHWVYAMRRPGKVEPPFSVVTVMRMEQTTPGSNVWRADVKVVVVCDVSQGGSALQDQRVGEVYEALEGTPQPASDAAQGVKLYGFTVDEIQTAKAEKVYADVIFLTAGVGEV
jgi:hypothetical protein